MLMQSSFLFQIHCFVLYLDFRNSLGLSMRDSLYDFSSNLLNVAVIKSILPAVHAFDHFEVFVDLSLLVSIPKGVVV